VRREGLGDGWLLSDVDLLCMYSYRTAMKHLGNLRFMPQFSEGFDCCLGAEKTYAPCFKEKIMFNTPQLTFTGCLFPFGKGSEAALIGHAREYRGRPIEPGGSVKETRQSTGERWGNTPEHQRASGSSALIPNPQKLVRAFGPRLQLPTVTPSCFSQACCLELRILPSAWCLSHD
jgi:hypothetical protein